MRKRSESARRIGRRIERPPAHWSILAVIVGALVLLLAAQGLSTQTTGASGTPPRAPGNAALHGNDAIWSVRGHQLAPHQRRAGRRVALTFDDGPDPRWTPRIAETLRRLGVPATFFEVGEHVVSYPGLARELEQEGFEIGNHTFSHTDLTQLPTWEARLQISLTDNAIAGAAGVVPRLVRPPYSSSAGAVTARQERAFATAAGGGRVIALSTLDSEDWRRPGVGQIVRNATPRRRGGVILFHDGGGNRAETVKAVERLVPRLKRRGFRFVSMSALAGAPPGQLDLQASGSEHLRGELLIGSLTVAGWVTNALLALLLPIAVLAVLRGIAVFALARRHVRERRGRPAGKPFTPPVSIVVPAFNEAAGIERAVRSLAGGDYPAHEVVVVDDGSTDGTGEIVERLCLAGVRLIRQTNSGKAGALNAGLRATTSDVVVTVDADTVFESSTLRRLVEPFADPRVGAAAGNTKVGNRRGLLGRWQHIDYVTGFNLDRRLYDVLRCMPTVPGAVGAFRREAIDAAGRFSTATLAEDTDLTIAVGRAGWWVVYVEDARAWTETPRTLSGLWRQRYRWSYGTLQAVWKHRAAIWRREPGKIGRRGLPYLILFQIALPFLAPLIDLAALYGVVFLDPLAVAAYWLGFNCLLLALGAFAFRLDGESLRSLWTLPLQQFVYRQLMYLVVIQAMISAVLGIRLRWQHVERTGQIEVATH